MSEEQPAQQQEPEIVQRVKRFAGQTLRTARNPNITARECIELANWLVANTSPQPAQQEPVAWIVEDQSGERLEWAGDAHSCHGVPTFPLYTSPPAQRTWVGLTDEEIEKEWVKMCGPQSWARHKVYARAIEAKLKEKNGG